MYVTTLLTPRVTTGYYYTVAARVCVCARVRRYCIQDTRNTQRVCMHTYDTQHKQRTYDNTETKRVTSLI